MPQPSATTAVHAALLLLVGVSAACRSPQAHVEDADRQVYAILENRREKLQADLGSVDIQPPRDSLRARLLESGPDGEPVVLDVLAALEVAAQNSRLYQTRKESLYLSALDLTLERWRLGLQPSGTLGAAVTGVGDEASFLDAQGDLTLSRVLGSGALVVGNIGIDLFRSLTTGDTLAAVSNVGFSVTQPLLRGFGRRIVEEPLTQAERDVVYEVRSFERFRRTFAVDVVARYLRLVQQVDLVNNERNNIKNLNEVSERNAALARAGRLSDIQVNQAKNDEMRSRDRLLREEQNFQTLLDDFKFFLGLPPQAKIQIVPDALERLADARPESLSFDDPDLLSEHALQWRLDHQTALDRVDDARRKTVVAADALRSRLDFTTGADAVSLEGKPQRLDLNDWVWSVGLDLDLAINNLPERNAYRASLITLQVSERNAAESGDGVRIEVRDSLREAQRTHQTWLLQREQVALNERQVESTRLNMQAGRASTRDILEAQEALLLAQNSATNALIDHHLAVLDLWNALEILRLDETGPHPDPEWLAFLEAPAP